MSCVTGDQNLCILNPHSTVSDVKEDIINKVSVHSLKLFS